jgi:hypothetical protein
VDAAVVERAPQAEHRLEESVAISYSIIDYESAQYFFDYEALGISHHTWLAPGFEIGTGLRLAFGNTQQSEYAAEAFGSLSFVPRFRLLHDDAGRTASWRPQAGIELGLTSAKVFFNPSNAPESIVRTDPSPGPLYRVFLARPLRFRFSSFHVMALGVGFGPAVGPGAKLRIQLDLLQIGLVL